MYSPSPIKSLRDYVEEAVKQEGLHKLIPEARYATLFTVHLASVLLGGLWALSAFSVIWRMGTSHVLLALLVAPGTAVLVLICLLGLLVVKFADKHGLKPGFEAPMANLIGSTVLAVLPVTVAVSTAVASKSWIVFFVVVLGYGLAAGLTFVVGKQGYRIHSFIETVRLILRLQRQSASLVGVLMPLLFIFILFPLFSQEMWDVLGNLPNERIPIVAFLIFLPAIVLTATTMGREISEIAGSLPSLDVLAATLADAPLLRKHLEAGLISREELSRIQGEIVWRHAEKIEEQLVPIIRSKVTGILLLLVLSLAITVFLVFLAYLTALSSALIDRDLVIRWIGHDLPPDASTKLFGYQVAVPWVIIKVSAILAAAISAVAIAYLLTDANVQERYAEWLKSTVRMWYAIATAYLSIISPGLQILQYKVLDKKRGIANMLAVFPPHYSEQEIEFACRVTRQQHSNFPLVIIRAFRRQEDLSTYGYGLESWQLFVNQKVDHDSFEFLPGPEEGLRNEHQLGLSLVRNGDPIPDEWFGESNNHQLWAKSIWEADEDHSLILHPYAREIGDKGIGLSVRTLRRLPSSTEYENLVRSWGLFALQLDPELDHVWIDVFYRESSDTLARLELNLGFDYSDYRDEHLKRGKFGPAKRWTR